MGAAITKKLTKLNYLAHHNFNRYCSEHPIKDTDNLSRSCKGIIVYLFDHSDEMICQKDIEKEFSIRKSTASSVISNMEEKGYVKRVSVEGDKRLKRIVLTEKANTITDHIKESQKYINEIITEGISVKEMDSFINTLDKMIYNLKEKKQ